MTELQCTIDELDKDAWHKVLGEFGDACLMQTWSYSAARWPGAKLSHVVVTRDGYPLAGAQVVLWPLPVTSGGLALVHYGPVWRPRSGQPDKSALTYLLQLLRNEYVDRRRMSLRIKPQASPWPGDAETISDVLADSEFELEPNTSTDRFVLDLQPSLEELHESLTGKWRYNLKRAQRNQLQVHHVSGTRGIEQFIALYDQMVARKAFVDNSGIDALPALYADLPTSMTPEILICEHEGDPVAGAVIAVIGDIAEYVFGATADIALKLRASYLVQWSAVEWLRERGVRWYDLGGGANNEGLRTFKGDLCGKRGSVVAMPGEFEMIGGLASRTSVHVALWGRRLLHAIKRVAGRTRKLSRPG